MKKVYVDMDGTLAEWRTDLRSEEELFEKGYFLNLRDNPGIVEAVKGLLENRNCEVYILSHYLEESLYAKAEKEEWLRRYLPELGNENIVFVPYGREKALYAGSEGALTKDDILLDDYSKNLFEWENAGGRGIKFMNGVNGTKGTWKGDSVSVNSTDIAKDLFCKVMEKPENELFRIMNDTDIARAIEKDIARKCSPSESPDMEYLMGDSFPVRYERRFLGSDMCDRGYEKEVRELYYKDIQFGHGELNLLDTFFPNLMRDCEDIRISFRYWVRIVTVSPERTDYYVFWDLGNTWMANEYTRVCNVTEKEFVEQIGRFILEENKTWYSKPSEKEEER